MQENIFKFVVERRRVGKNVRIPTDWPYLQNGEKYGKGYHQS